MKQIVCAALAAVFGLPQCMASTSIVAGDGWHTVLCSESTNATDSLGPYLFTCSTPVVLTIADVGLDYEQYVPYDSGTIVGTTSVPGKRGVSISSPDSAFVSAQWSHGQFNLDTGSHSISVKLSATGPGDFSGLAEAFLRVDAVGGQPGSAFPHVPVQLSVASNYSIGQNPVSIAVADLNQDGNLDIVTANDSTSDLSILLGDGKGGFTLKTNYVIGTVPEGVAAADFDGDGIPDLVATRAYGNSAILLKGLGDGNFAPATYWSLNASAADGAVATGDFNNDGKPDFVTVLHTIGFSACLGAGAGTFSNAIPNFTVYSDKALAAGDFRGIGRLDLAIPYAAGKSLSVLFGNGDGTFTTASNYVLPASPSTQISGVVAVADMNGDQKLDMVVAEQAATNTVTVLLGNGDGSFMLKTNYNLGLAAVTVALGDLDGDEIPDLVIGAGSTVYVLLGNGDGSFGPAVNFPVANAVESLAIADINGDGQADVISANLYGSISVLLNQTHPPLYVSMEAGQTVLAWPSYAFGFQLQTTTNCTDRNSWSPVSGTPVLSGAQYVFTNAMDVNQRFYYLRK